MIFRRDQGLCLNLPVGLNLNLPIYKRISNNLLISSTQEKTQADRQIADLRIKTPTRNALASSLSGGNQQKIVIGKWLATAPKLLLLDEPTNGVDVGAKFEIHNLIADLKQQGVAILMVSSELPEVLGVADRIVVLSGGRVAGELPRGASEEQVMSLAFKYA